MSDAQAALAKTSRQRSPSVEYFSDGSFLEASGGKVTYNTFTGADLKCSILMPNPPGMLQYLKSIKANQATINAAKLPYFKTWAELQTLSISSARDVFPVRRLGETHAHEYTRGGRTIAGTMVFTTFTRDVFAEFYRLWPGERFVQGASQGVMHVDQIPPFHILINAANEYGALATSALINVTLSNFGTTMSIHDLAMESTYTYVAQHYFPFVQDTSSFMEMLDSMRRKRSPVALSNLVAPVKDQIDGTRQIAEAKPQENWQASLSRVFYEQYRQQGGTSLQGGMFDDPEDMDLYNTWGQ